MKFLQVKMLALGLLTLALASCGFGLPNLGGPSAPCSVATSQQAAERLVQRISEANKSHGKTVTITATSEEVSSVLWMFVQEAKQRNPETVLPIDQPTVCFQHGKLTVTGTVTLEGNNSVSALISATPHVNAGKLSFTIEDVQFGPFPVPQAFHQQISTMLNQSLNRYLTQVEVSEIVVSDGQMKVTGKVP